MMVCGTVIHEMLKRRRAPWQKEKYERLLDFLYKTMSPHVRHIRGIPTVTCTREMCIELLDELRKILIMCFWCIALILDHAIGIPNTFTIFRQVVSGAQWRGAPDSIFTTAWDTGTCDPYRMWYSMMCEACEAMAIALYIVSDRKFLLNLRLRHTLPHMFYCKRIAGQIVRNASDFLDNLIMSSLGSLRPEELFSDAKKKQGNACDTIKSDYISLLSNTLMGEYFRRWRNHVRYCKTLLQQIPDEHKEEGRKIISNAPIFILDAIGQYVETLKNQFHEKYIGGLLPPCNEIRLPALLEECLTRLLMDFEQKIAELNNFIKQRRDEIAKRKDDTQVSLVQSMLLTLNSAGCALSQEMKALQETIMKNYSSSRDVALEDDEKKANSAIISLHKNKVEELECKIAQYELLVVATRKSRDASVRSFRKEVENAFKHVGM